MQNSIKNPQEMVLFSVPAELLEEADISEGDVLQMYVEDGSLIIEPLYDADEIVCREDCSFCPIAKKNEKRG